MKILGQFKLHKINSTDIGELAKKQAQLNETMYEALQHKAQRQAAIAKRTRTHHRAESEQSY